MAFTSTLSLYSYPQVRLRNQRLQSLALTAAGVAQFAPLPVLNCWRTCSPRARFGSFVVRASSSVEGTRPRAAGSRRVYRQSQANAPVSSAPVKQIANIVAPFAAFFALTFVISYHNSQAISTHNDQLSGLSLFTMISNSEVVN